MAEPTIQALARKLAEWFPELGGRSIAVSEVDPFDNQTNVPTLPLAIVALVSEAGQQGTNGQRRIEITDDLLVQFMFKPEKYDRSNGQKTPFYSFYDYEGYRDRLLMGLQGYRSPSGGGFSYRRLDVESDEFAVYLSFRLSCNYTWCPPDVETEGGPFPVAFDAKLLYPSPCEPDCPPDPDCEPKCNVQEV